MADFVVGVQAYCKLFLHAMKYPHCAVNGVLLAKDSQPKDKIIHFVDCIPLFHLALGLSPMLEIALLQIDTYCRSIGYVIAGYYQANEIFEDNQLSHVAKTIGKKIQEYYCDACILQLDNRRLNLYSVSEVYKVYVMKDHWTEAVTCNSTVDEETLSNALALLRSGAERKLVDFDQHLDNIVHDWRNPELSELIAG